MKRKGDERKGEESIRKQRFRQKIKYSKGTILYEKES